MTHILKGGEYIGSGSFGCVMKPHIECKNTINLNKYANNNIISKMSTYKYYDSDSLENIYDEINICEKVLKIDKECKYLCPILKYCNIIQDNVIDRNDIKFQNLSTMEDIDLYYDNKGYEKQCIFNLNSDFITINLISIYAGPDIESFINTPALFKKYNQLLKTNFKTIVIDLLDGLKTLHSNKITHKDIKLSNLCLLIKNGRPIVRYIDFGLSEDLKTLKHTANNIINSGTPSYMAPDFIILIELKKHKFTQKLDKNKFKHKIINKLFNSIKSNFSTFTNKGLNKTYLNGNFNTINSELYYDDNYNEKKHTHYFITKTDIITIYLFLLNLNKNDELLHYYFKDITGLNAKFDIFGLGLVIFEIAKKLNIQNILLLNLIKNMLEFNSINRFSIEDCIDHYYINN